VKPLINALVFLLAGTGLGLASADYAVQHGFVPLTIAVGPWTAWTDGSNPYSRAHHATAGHLPVGWSEALVFRASRDSRRYRLDADCSYVVEGTDPDARLWTLAAYDADLKPIANPSARHSVNSETVVRDSAGRLRIALARDAQPGNWLPLGDNSAFVIVLSLINPSEEVRNAPHKAELPNIRRELCR
jgi:hypothetical protein